MPSHGGSSHGGSSPTPTPRPSPHGPGPSEATPTPRPGINGPSGGGFGVDLDRLHGFGNRLSGLGDNIGQLGGKIGSLNFGSSTFGTIGQSFAGNASTALQQTGEQVNRISQSIHNAADLTHRTGHDYQQTEQDTADLLDRVNPRTGPLPRGGTPGSGLGSGRTYGPSSTHQQGSIGTSAPPGTTYQPSYAGEYPGGQRSPGPDGTPDRPWPIGSGMSKPGTHYGAGAQDEIPPGEPTSTIPPGAHHHSIYGEYKPNGSIVGGHAWTGALQPHTLDPDVYGMGVTNHPSTGSDISANGVYVQHNPAVHFPGYDPTEKTNSYSTMFPPDLGAHQIQNVANEAWNGGHPSGGIDETSGRWFGHATLPNGMPIQIQGFKDPATGQVTGYRPSSWQ